MASLKRPTKPRQAKLAVVADCHLGNYPAFGGEVHGGLNARGRLTLETLARAVATAKAQGATHLVVAGDLFDSCRPEPAIIAGAQRIFHEDCQDLGVILVPGNHDMVDADPASTSTALEPLRYDCTIVREPTWYSLPGLSLLCVPWSSRMPMAAYVAQALEEPPPALEDQPRVLVAHVGVYGEDAPPWCLTARDGMAAGPLLERLAAAGIKEAYVGNYHRHDVWQTKDAVVVQVGTLCPKNFSDVGLWPDVGGIAFSSPGGLLEVPGPRFLILRGGAETPKRVEEGCTLYVRAVEVGGKKPVGLERASAVDHVVEEEAAPEASAPRQVEGGEEAITEWAAAQGVDQEALDLARGYWRRSA